MKIKPNPGILDIAAYVGGESKADGAQRIIKLSSNENPFGASPKALEVLTHDLHLEKYPDGNCLELRKTIANKFALEESRIVCGAGSDEIIGLLCKAYIGPGDEVMYATHAFLMYGIFARGCGGVPVETPENNLTPDLDAMLAAVTDKTRMVFLTNPNNPTGSFNTPAEIKVFREKLRGDILLVLDDAYAEYAQATQGYENGFGLAKNADNIVVLRTFSKIYGLAGLRLGYGYCPVEIADVLNRVRGPFNVSVPAQIAGIAALGDDTFIERSVSHNTEWRAWTAEQLVSTGLKIRQSAANFLLLEYKNAEQAEGCRQFLKSRGILVRQMGAYKLPSALRVSIGTGEEMNLAVAAIKEYLEQV
ncbi:MAG: histidinol-phosphate transaminase [Micavibrio aeruginosavorus]|uniref:Histidinol-phosphate aminotransferase n=1 Tax=Micavibrio aeruginosavorus TaxID=349221 RepID=A0A2W5N119_9BACT|nr:MAG: histidinol-phosphate transaminase [Micavibrio aeruginosavorus]